MNALDLSPHQAELAKPPALTCFKAYDVRGRVGQNLDTEIAFRIGRAFARVMAPGSVVVGRDCRDSSPALHGALCAGLNAEGVDVFDIGLAGTEEVYFATDHLRAGGGIEITASHNPIGDNGMKFVGRGSRPMSSKEFSELARDAAVLDDVDVPDQTNATRRAFDIKKPFADKISSFVDTNCLRPLKIVVNAGNGVAGPAFDVVAGQLAALGAELDIVRVDHYPDATFPNGIPNPLLWENRSRTADMVMATKADIGIAWDGDFDRCFIFDETGAFVDGQYVVALLAKAFLAASPGEKIVHDPRVVLNTLEVVQKAGGKAIGARTGHAHIKQAMRDNDAIYGGEMSAHHYFRDFMYCDSGMVPWVKIIELMGATNLRLSELVMDMQSSYPSSGEINFRVSDPLQIIGKVREKYSFLAADIDELDGLSMTFDLWRLNIRCSNTEPLLRLNVESSGDENLVSSCVTFVRELCEGQTPG